MDPPLINEGSFSAINPSLEEIWPFNGENSQILGLGMGSGGFATSFIDNLLNNNVVEIKKYRSIEESNVTEQSGNCCVNVRKRRENVLEDDESSKVVSTTCSGNYLKNSNGKRLKSSKEENESSKVDDETGSVKAGEKQVEPVKDYLHVRARRGQATDSHSLAERARREKISERMKVLQDLVPRCNQVIGKALVLDEIINYVQSLQRQVEFLSMKLEAVNSEMIPSMGGFLSKDVNQNGIPAFDSSGMMFSAQAARELAAIVAAGGPQSEWLHMQLGGSFER